jgi:hypothetical protein
MEEPVLVPFDAVTFVYVLRDPETLEVRYVGVTDNPKSRLEVHVAKVMPHGSPKDRWILSLLERKLYPELCLVEAVPYEEREAAEARWILFFESQGASLTNKKRRHVRQLLAMKTGD